MSRGPSRRKLKPRSATSSCGLSPPDPPIPSLRVPAAGNRQSWWPRSKRGRRRGPNAPPPLPGPWRPGPNRSSAGRDAVPATGHWAAATEGGIDQQAIRTGICRAASSTASASTGTWLKDDTGVRRGLPKIYSSIEPRLLDAAGNAHGAHGGELQPHHPSMHGCCGSW